MNEILTVLISILSILITSLVTWLTQRLIVFLNNKIKDERTKKAMERVTLSISDSVKTVTQTYVDTLKKSGEFDTEKAKAALQKAMSLTINSLSDEIIDILKQESPHWQDIIESKIEATIYDLKERNKNV